MINLVWKRATVISTAAVMVLAASIALAGCDSGDSSGGGSGSSAEAAKQEAKSDYAVTIDACETSADYEGAPAIIVDYTFTNNSEEDTSFAVACSQKAFQNGVELETAVVEEDLGNGYMAEIKPGATIQARIAYKLADESEVTVEVEEFFSLDEVMLAEKTFSVA